MTEQIFERDAYEIADLVRGKELAATEVLDAFAERIDAYNEALNALVYVDLERARADAAEIDARIAKGDDPGPLAGVPIGIKDLEDVAGMPTTYGSVPYADNVAQADGIQTGRLRAAGAVIVGKTAAPEFGAEAMTRTFLHGTTRNPWKLERTPGGSSGGSAAAVAAAILPIASGSDGGGSIRIPASYSGLAGMKGTFGRIPKGGIDASLTTVYGCMARSLRDTARYWDCVVGAHERDALSLPHPGFSYEAVLDETPRVRATWSDDLGYQQCRTDILEMTRAAAFSLDLDFVDRPVALKDMSAAWGLFNMPGTWLEVRDFWPDRRDDFTPVIRASMAGVDRFSVDQLARAVERRQQNNAILAEVFRDVDVILTPTTGTTAFPAEGPMPTEIEGRPIKAMHSIYTYPFNVSGHPACSVPCGFDADGLPVALQIIGRRHEDHIVMQIARAFERARPWPKIAPDYR